MRLRQELEEMQARFEAEISRLRLELLKKVGEVGEGEEEAQGS